jgi:histidine triad (HIT) family protein
MTDACIFCRIAAGDIPATVIDRAEGVIAIEDLSPQAPTHVLVLPREHHETVADLAASGDEALLGRIFATAANIGRQRGGNDGFRLVVNSGPNAGQSVGHLHVHVLAGRPLGWPPG